MSLQKRFEALFAAMVLSAAGPAAADAGLGAAFNDGTTVIVPIRTANWLIEPQLLYVDSKNGSNTSKSMNPGVGVYLRKEVGPLFEAYYGGILAYNQSKSNFGVEQKTTTFSIAPTIGIAHYFSKQFSLGVDAGLKYTDGTQKTSGAADVDIRTWQTVTRIVVRAFFF